MPSKVARAHHALSSQQANQVDTGFPTLQARTQSLVRLNNPAKVSQLVVAELGLRPGSDPDAGAHRRRRGGHRQEEQQAGCCPRPVQGRGGSGSGQESVELGILQQPGASALAN